MEGYSRDWAGLVVDILECISGRLTDPNDFVRFRAVCPQWRDSIPVTHARFSPWILNNAEVRGSGDIMFYSLGTRKIHKKHVPALEGKTTRIVVLGAGLLIGIDCDDELSAVLVNPLTGNTNALPRLPEWCQRHRDCLIHGFVTDPKVTGEEDVFVVIYGWRWVPVGQERLDHVALWRLGDAGGWATIPRQRFWPMMTQYMSRLSKHGPRMLEEEMATAAGGGGGEKDGLTNAGKALVPGMESAYLIENKDRVEFLSQHWMYTDTDHLPQPQVTFELHDLLGDSSALVDWDNAPELHDKVILDSGGDTLCYCLPASDDLAGLRLSKNCIYYLSHLTDSVGGQAYYLVKWDLNERIATVVNRDETDRIRTDMLG